MLPDVYGILAAAPAVTALLGPPPRMRVYRHGQAPQDVAAPYVTWFVVTSVPQIHLNGTPPVDAVSVEVDCWSNNDGSGDAAVEQLAIAVRNALEVDNHVTSIFSDSQNSESKRFRIGMNVSIWLARTA